MTRGFLVQISAQRVDTFQNQRPALTRGQGGQFRGLDRTAEEAIHGAGAFRMFKSVIRRRGMEKDWHSFRDRALEQIAREWCEENDIPFS